MNYFKALETDYNGITFRNRLNARWAVYFDNVGIEYMYEPKEYVLSGDTSYVPDFYLPDFVCFADVKEDYMHGDEIIKAEKFVIDKKFPLMILKGSPSLTYYEYVIPTVEDGKDKYTVKMINVAQAPSNSKNKFILEKYLEGESQFREYGLTKAIQAVKAANNFK